ncbi:MAG: HNH endonuclease [Ardenticatenaceae bacterium]|nr:HNH endonuclease [Ardenticatenaceae bacterium]
MPRPTAALKKIIIERANNLCEYCKSPADYSPQPFSIEHIYPASAGGQFILDNLAYACQGCNNHKYTKTHGIDPLSGAEVPLFHPRQDIWLTHFGWGEGGLTIIGLTGIGRATVYELHLNRQNLVNLRTLLLLADLHPPDP